MRCPRCRPTISAARFCMTCAASRAACASLLLGRLDEAWSLANSAVQSSPRQSGYAAHALHLLGDMADPSRSLRRRARRGAPPPGAGPRRAAQHAPARCPLHLGLGKLYRDPAATRGTGAPHPRATMYRGRGHALLAGAGDSLRRPREPLSPVPTPRTPATPSSAWSAAAGWPSRAQPAAPSCPAGSEVLQGVRAAG